MPRTPPAAARADAGVTPIGADGPARRSVAPQVGMRRAPTSSASWTGEALLPAITFIFSRVGCEAAVGQLLGSGDPADHRRAGRTQPSAGRGTRRRNLADEDLGVLGYWDFVEGI
jgi:hypothetical protein